MVHAASLLGSCDLDTWRVLRLSFVLPLSRCTNSVFVIPNSRSITAPKRGSLLGRVLTVISKAAASVS
jgi:hypothetical protein